MAYQLTKEQIERINYIRSKAEDRFRSEFVRFNANVEKLYADYRAMEDKKYSFWERLSWIPSMLYSAYTGGVNGIASIVQTFNVIGTQLINDLADVFDGEGDYNEDLNYAFANAGITLAEGFSNSAISMIANFGRFYESGLDKVS